MLNVIILGGSFAVVFGAAAVAMLVLPEPQPSWKVRRSMTARFRNWWWGGQSGASRMAAECQHRHGR